MSVETIASSGMAFSSSRSSWRGCMSLRVLAQLRPNRDRARGSSRRAPSPRPLLPRRSSRCVRLGSRRRHVRPQALGQRRGRGVRIAADADRDRLHETEHARVDVDLDDLRVLRPVVDAVLRQRAEGPEARAERQHHVGLRNQLHRRLRALVAERAEPQRMRAGNESLCR